MIVLPTDEDPEADAATDSDDPDHVSRVVLREHIHELTHYYQVLMCGSIYKSVEIASSVVLPRALAMINDLGRAGAPFSTIVEAVDQVGAAASAEELDRILFRHETLETPDEGGLSADCLTEGHAFWVETVIGRTDLDGPAYAKLLDARSPAPRYRSAFDLAAETLGSDLAFRLFPLLPILALNCSDPVMSYRLLVAECARLFPPPRERVDIVGLDVTHLIKHCCGFTYFGTPLIEDEKEWRHTAYSSALTTLRKGMRDVGLDWLGLVMHFPDSMPWLLSQVEPVRMLDPEPDGSIPFRGPSEEASRAWLSGLLAAVEFELHRAARSGGGAAAVERDRARWRSESLALVAEGHVNTYYNLGLAAARENRSLEAKAWWMLAAEQGDQESGRCLGLLERRSGRIEASDYWLENHGSGSPFRFQSVLEQLAGKLETTEPAAVRACLRRSAQLGSRSAEISYALKVEPDDPTLAVLYLMAAARPIAVPGSQEDAASFRRAVEELRRMKAARGPRAFRRDYKKARTEFLRCDDTRELP